jgi:hypothetical protein
VAAATVIAAAGCGAAAQPAMEQIVPPAGGNASVINCLTEQATELGYRILRKDPGDGFLEAERRGAPLRGDPRKYAAGDRFTVQRGPKGADGIRPLNLNMTSFRMDFLVNGPQQTLAAPSDSGKADMEKFMAACGPLAPASSQ